MTSTTLQHAPLGKLSIDPKNIRKAGRGHAEEAFVGSIERRGVIEPMQVRTSGEPGHFLITNGGKRFAALQHMLKKNLKANGTAVTESFPVAIIVRDESDADATETSLITNIVRAPTHPVDEFEAFAELIQFGDNVEDIARRYGMKVIEVRQALSIAAIHPDIRQAWREGKIGAEAAEAYAQTKDLEHQLRVFKKLKGHGADSEYNISKELFGGGTHDVAHWLGFVGEKEYEAAGHYITRSLFDESDRRDLRVDNVPALKAMVAKKLEAECAKLIEQGWNWAITEDDEPNDINSWRRLPHGVTPTKEQKAAAGCVVGFDYAGKLKIERGYIKPGVNIKLGHTSAQKAATQKAKKAREESGGINNALAFRLSQQITRAAHDALLDDPMLALRVAIAGMACSDAYDSPAKIRLNGMADLNDDEHLNRTFDKYLDLTKGKSVPDLLKLLAVWTAKSLDMTCHQAGAMPLNAERIEDDPTDAALINALPSKSMNAALRKSFDAADYFKSVNGEMVRSAISEMGGTALASKNAELVEVAVAKQKGCGWLPRELRTDHYDGPVFKPAAPAKAKAPAKPKGKAGGAARKRKAA